MSLISDAIKKAQKKREVEREKIDYLPPPEEPPPEGSRIEKKVIQIAVAILLIFIAIFVLGLVIARLAPRATTSKAPKMATAVEKELPPQPAEQKPPAPSPSPEPQKKTPSPSLAPVPSQPQPLKPVRQERPAPPRQPEEKKVRKEEKVPPEPKFVIVRKEKKKASCEEILRADPQAAEKCFEQEAAHRQKDFHFLFNYGACKLKLKKWAEAEEILRRAIALKPDSSKGWFNYGIALFRQQKYEQAASAFSLSLRFSPSVKEANYYLGVINDLQGNIRAARFYYALSLESNIPQPLKEWVKQRLAELEK